MTGTARIRWDPTGYGGWTGHVGTRADHDWLFQVWSAASVGGKWQLDSSLPGDFRHIETSDDPDELKAEAERWLEEFVRSLGAVFPAEPLSGDQRFQVSEARDLLARWDRERFSEDGYAAERTLADQVRALLAIVDQVAPETPEETKP